MMSLSQFLRIISNPTLQTLRCKPFLPILNPHGHTQSRVSFNRKLSSMTENSVKLDSQTIHYMTQGSGPHPVLLLPGALGTAKSDFWPTIDGINTKNQLTVIAWDPPGYGKSRPPTRTWPLDFFARDAELAVGLMDALGHDRFSLAGWSDGGITAMAAATRYPTRLRKLILWGANSYISTVDLGLVEGVRDISKWSDRMRKPMEEVYGEEYFPVLWGEWCDAYMAIGEKNGGEVCARRLGDIRCPTLIVHGDKDAMLDPVHPEHLRKNIEGAVLKRFPDGKHNLHFKYKMEFNKMVEDFLLQ